MLQEAQQKCANLVSENAKLRSGGQVVSSSRPGANGKAPHRKDATRQPIGALQHDYKLRTDIMDDDLSFIQEVVTGTATAIPDFNPEVVRVHSCSCVADYLCIFGSVAALI